MSPCVLSSTVILTCGMKEWTLSNASGMEPIQYCALIRSLLACHTASPMMHLYSSNVAQSSCSDHDPFSIHELTERQMG